MTIDQEALTYLRRLESRQDKMERALKSVADTGVLYLPYQQMPVPTPLPNFSAVYATRTRSILMAPAAFITSWPDSSTTSYIVFVVIPADYVPGTNLTVQAFYRPRATGNVVWQFTEFVHIAGETFGTRNPENAVQETQALVNNVMSRSARTISGTTFSLVAGDILWFKQDRIGANASDTLAAGVDIFGAYMTYTAQF